MFLKLSQIRTTHEHVSRRYPPEAFRGDQDGFTVVAPVALDVDVFKDKEHFRLAGTVKTTLELPCSRCLEPLPWPVDASFDLRYLPAAEPGGEGEREIDEDDFSTAYYEHDEIDLGQLMREQFLLSIPMKPLCREACAGLCPVCGTNLNAGTCGCTRDWDDPRLAALKQLKKDS